MLKKFVVSTAVLAATSFAVAQPAINIVDLGGGSFDVQVADLNGGTVWTAGGIAGSTSGGASFVYATDPNGMQTLDNAQGNNANITFFSLPTGQNANKRFNGARPVSFAGKYLGGTGAPTADPSAMDIAFFDAPGGAEGNTGFIARVGLDTSGTGFAAGDIVAAAGAAPNGTTVLASGVVTSTTDAFTDAGAAQIDWVVYAIPEPATLALLALGGLAAFRRR